MADYSVTPNLNLKKYFHGVTDWDEGMNENFNILDTEIDALKDEINDARGMFDDVDARLDAYEALILQWNADGVSTFPDLKSEIIAARGTAASLSARLDEIVANSGGSSSEELTALQNEVTTARGTAESLSARLDELVTQIDSKLDKTGGTITGSLAVTGNFDMGNFRFAVVDGKLVIQTIV